MVGTGIFSKYMSKSTYVTATLANLPLQLLQMLPFELDRNFYLIEKSAFLLGWIFTGSTRRLLHIFPLPDGHAVPHLV